MGDLPRLYEAMKEVLGPISAALVMIEPLWAPPNMREIATAALLEQTNYLYNLLVKLNERLGDEIAAKVGVEETMELIMQTLANMGRTVNREKRRMMAHVVVM